MEEKEYRQLVYEQLSSLTVATAALSRAVTDLYMDKREHVPEALTAAMSELSEAFERLDMLAGRGE